MTSASSFCLSCLSMECNAMKNATFIVLTTTMATIAIPCWAQSSVRDFGPPVFAGAPPSASAFAPPVQLNAAYALERIPYASSIGYQPINYSAYRAGFGAAPADLRPSLAPVAPRNCAAGLAYRPANVVNYPGYNARYPQSYSGAAYWSSSQPRQYNGQSLFGSPTVYAKDQPLRNFVRFLVP